MTRHHPGDGCHGDSRPLSPQDHEAIADQMGNMMVAAAQGDGRTVLSHGAFIGVHYGAEGEWVLAQRLAFQIVALAPKTDCLQDGTPVLGKAFAPDDTPVLVLTAHCISQFPETRTHTRQEITQAVKAAVPLVERFVTHFRHKRRDDCRAAWEAMYEMTSTEAEPTRENTLRAGACSALLTSWGAHYSAVRLEA
jgi:hypothetical protein